MPIEPCGVFTRPVAGRRDADAPSGKAGQPALLVGGGAQTTAGQKLLLAMMSGAASALVPVEEPSTASKTEAQNRKRTTYSQLFDCLIRSSVD
jgi:hypothetical protein